MKALVGAFNQEKALVGAFSVIVQPVVETMDRFAALKRAVKREDSGWIYYIAHNIIYIYIILSLNIYKTNIEVEIHLCVAKYPHSSKYDMITTDSRNMHRDTKLGNRECWQSFWLSQVWLCGLCNNPGTNITVFEEIYW